MIRFQFIQAWCVVLIVAQGACAQPGVSDLPNLTPGRHGGAKRLVDRE